MKRCGSLVFAAAFLVGGSLTAKADQPGSDWMPGGQVKQKVMPSGYTQVTKLKADESANSRSQNSPEQTQLTSRDSPSAVT